MPKQVRHNNRRLYKLNYLIEHSKSEDDGGCLLTTFGLWLAR